MKPRPQVLAIVGLTVTGKTELACEVARRTGEQRLLAVADQLRQQGAAADDGH